MLFSWSIVAAGWENGLQIRLIAKHFIMDSFCKVDNGVMQLKHCSKVQVSWLQKPKVTTLIIDMHETQSKCRIDRNNYDFFQYYNVAVVFSTVVCLSVN